MTDGKRIVIALGGNALQKQGEATAEAQQRVAAETAQRLVPLIKQGYQLVIVHGNGPQVGNIVLHEEAINTEQVPTLPLDSCVAMSQGSIGYWLQQALINEFTREHMHSTAATVVTQMVVDEHDEAFSDPSKPIGPFYETEQAAKSAAHERGFVVKQDAGRGWRRVVPSPTPISAVEDYTIRSLIDAGVTVITGGGGGVPVVKDETGFTGVEAVIDKDFSAAVIAEIIGADKLIILTAVDYVMTGFATQNQRELRDVSKQEMSRYIEQGEFAAGSMLPKVKAALRFLVQPGRSVAIGSLDKVEAVINQTSGTHIAS